MELFKALLTSILLFVVFCSAVVVWSFYQTQFNTTVVLQWPSNSTAKQFWKTKTQLGALFEPQYEDYNIIFLFWTTVFRQNYSYSDPQHFCTVVTNQNSEKGMKVLISSDKNLENYANAFVFHAPDLLRNGAFETNFRKRRRSDDIYVMNSRESPANYPILSQQSVMKRFDLLMSYRGDADIYDSYLTDTHLRQLVSREKLVPFSEKNSKMVAWFGSNCAAHNGRQTYLKSLFEHIPTDSYGRCLNNVNTKAENNCRGDCMIDTVSRYKFYIVFENSNCEGYITEKLAVAIRASVVPIVFSVNGGTRPDYDYWLPRHSYINAADFNSTFELAQFLIKVGSNETLYDSYLWYKFSNTDADRNQLYQSIYELNPYRNHRYSDVWCGAAQSLYDYVSANQPKRSVADNACEPRNCVLNYI